VHWWTRAASLFLTLLFVGSALDKAFHLDGFVKALGSYVVVPEAFAGALAPAVIGLEAWVGVGLSLRRWRHPAATAAVALLALMTAALAVNAVYAPGSVCGCWFTLTLGEATGAHVVLNLLFLALAFTLWRDSRASTEAEPAPSHPERAPGSGRSVP